MFFPHFDSRKLNVLYVRRACFLRHKMTATYFSQQTVSEGEHSWQKMCALYFRKSYNALEEMVFSNILTWLRCEWCEPTPAWLLFSIHFRLFDKNDSFSIAYIIMTSEIKVITVITCQWLSCLGDCSNIELCLVLCEAHFFLVANVFTSLYCKLLKQL